MYIPEHFDEHDSNRIQQLIDEHGFGLLVTVDADRPCGSHIPFLKDGNCLLSHLARSNSQVGHLEASDEVLVVFSGPETDRENVMQYLHARGSDNSVATAKLMRETATDK